MHDYLRAVGFSSVKRKKDMEELIQYVVSKCSESIMIPVASDCKLEQCNKDFGPSFGITVVGEYDENDIFRPDHCFPYCVGQYITQEESIGIKKIADKEAYSGFCDDDNLGCSMIFFLQNIMDYVKNCWSNVPEMGYRSVRLGALSVDGSIILGCEKSAEDYADKTQFKEFRKRELRRAKEGDAKAAELLAMQEMETYALIANRLDMREDVYTIVDTTFMPYGVECDQYTIMGTIISIHKYINIYSFEEVWVLALECNDIIITVCINDKDLLGEPMVGRRFKGTIWLQGYVEM